MRKINVAIIGATGVVGEAMIESLMQSSLKVDKLYPLASKNSIGKTVLFNQKNIPVNTLEEFDFSKVDLTLSAAGSAIAKAYADKIISSGSHLIDNSTAFREADDIPLVVPEINGHLVKNITKPSIIANPNCSTIQMCIALEPIQKLADITRVHVSTYQSVSGTGRKAISELVSQTTELLNGKFAEPKVYPKQIAFNAIPHIDDFCENGYTKEEMKMHNETKKIFEDDGIVVNATTVRIPTIFGHAESINVETSSELDLDQLKQEFHSRKGIKFFQNNDYPTCMSDCVGKNEVFIGRVRKDITNPNAINLWVVADNIRKGAAWNAIQIAELLYP